MGERNFGDSFESGALSMNRESELHAGNIPENIPDQIPSIPTPGPKIGPDFSNENEKNKKNESTEEKFNYDDIAGKILKRIDEIDLDNVGSSYEKIVVKDVLAGLENEDEEVAERIEEDACIIFSLAVNHLQNEKREKMDMDRRRQYLLNQSERRDLHSTYRIMAMRDSEWMFELQKHVYQNRDNPEEIHQFWEDFDKYYLELEAGKKNILDDESDHDKIKFGVLAELAAKDLMEEVENEAKALNISDCGSLKIDIVESTAKEDVVFKTDFYARIFYKGETKMIPVQVKSCNISTGVSSFEDETRDKERKRFVLDNVFERFSADQKFKESDLNQKGYKGVTYMRKKGFVEKALKHHNKPEGYFIIIPRGSERKEGEYLREDGSVSESVKHEFMKNVFKEVFKVNYDSFKNKQSNHEQRT